MNRETAEPDVRSLPGENARAWIDHHHAVAAPSEHAHEFVWDVTADAEGPFVTDVDGNVLLDFTSHIGAAPLGYNNPHLLSKMADVTLVDPLKIAGQDLYFAHGPTPEASALPGSSDLMHRLVEASAHYEMDTVFLSNSGAEAVENAMKIAYDATPTPKYAVTFSGSFHGRTLGALSLTRTKPVFTRKYPELAGTRTLPYCTCTGDCACGFFAGETSMLRRLFEGPGGHLHPDEVAFCILEPVQGVGGYNVPSERFMREVDAVCREYDVAVVADEIQSGVGRTGEHWAVDHFPLDPDVVVGGKALRVGATVSRSDVFPREENRVGSTWGAGDLLASMQGAFTLDVVEECDLHENARVRGDRLRRLLAEADLPGVTDVRGLGLMLAVEFDTAARRDAVVEAAVRRGLLVLGCGERAIRLLPPLDVTDREVDLGVDLFASAAATSAR